MAVVPGAEMVDVEKLIPGFNESERRHAENMPNVAELFENGVVPEKVPRKLPLTFSTMESAMSLGVPDVVDET